MGTLTLRDAEEILQMFEKELNTIPGLARIEKMKLRKKIVNTLRPVLLEKGQNAKVILNIVDDKLYNVLSLFFDEYGFRKKLANLLSQKFRK